MRGERAVGRAGGESVDVVARTYHTENGVEHVEGETYAVTDRGLAETLRGIGFVSIDGWTDASSGTPPALTSLTPSTVALGAPSFTLSVRGTGLVDGAVIVFAGNDEPTTWVSDAEVTTGVDMAVWLGPDTVPVAVRGLEGALSNTLLFTFTATKGSRHGR
jgi:hypothetical protein